MKLRFTAITAAISIVGLMASPMTLANSVEQQLAKLQKEVNSLKRQVAHSKRINHSGNVGQVEHKQVVQYSSGEDVDPNEQVRPVSNIQTTPQVSKKDLIKIIGQQGDEYLPFDLTVPGQSFVSTGPYIGVPIQFAGANLLVNSPSVNTDVQVLNLRKNIHRRLNALGLKQPGQDINSHLLLSGALEVKAGYFNNGGRPSTTNIDVSNVAIDGIFLGPNNYTLGFFEINYDGSSPKDSPYSATSNFTSSSSRLFINKAFITIGNFNHSPWYGSAGQFFVPFGTYSSVMSSDTLTKLLGRTKGRALLVGYQSQDAANGVYGAGYIFRGDSKATTADRVRNGGVNLGYKFTHGTVRGNIGAGMIANIADSGGMQVLAGFQNNESIAHTVPALNLRGTINIGDHIDLIAEYVGATKRFDLANIGYNGRGAKPWAIDTQASYSFTAFDRPSAIGIGYGQSHEALGLGIPLSRTSVVFNTSYWRNTLQTIEFRHDRDYSVSAIGTSTGGIVSTSNNGKSDNAITAAFAYYF